MFQRFASALFGDNMEELSRGNRPGDGKEEEEDDEDWILVNYLAGLKKTLKDESPPHPLRSCTSLNSTADTDPDGGGFLRLDACSLEESWFVTPPPCFTGRGSKPILLETSPLENLLIEHPSMSVYAHHSPPRLTLDALPLISVFSRRSSLHSACYAAALSARPGLLQPRAGNAAQRTQPLSRNALRRHNLLRPPKAGTVHLHQPNQRHLNF
uniref:Tumor protein p53 inducible nuclear protein 1 n=1 Tax=Labrus bergylta TaxID=56723 RepID=A0A3Q3FY15_9LABR